MVSTAVAVNFISAGAIAVAAFGVLSNVEEMMNFVS